MKKIVFILLSLLIIFIAAVYIFIPPVKTISYNAEVQCAGPAVQRLIIYKNNWEKWWPGKKVNDTLYSLGDFNYSIDKILPNGVETMLMGDDDMVSASITYNSIPGDSTRLGFVSNIPLSGNPFTRFFQNMETGKVAASAAQLLDGMSAFFNKQENVYGLKINIQKVRDSSLIAVNQAMNHYPSVTEIYKTISEIQGYIQSKGGMQADSPMLNVYTDDSINFQVMIAIPTKGDMPSSGKFQLKKMVLGNILMGEVRGGITAIAEGDKQLINYITDYHKTSPAIPYQMLITNRMQETDTAKWVTQLYYPVFY